MIILLWGVVQYSNYSSSYEGIELFHKASVLGKNEDLYEVEFALGTTRVFSFEILVWYGFCRTVIGASGKFCRSERNLYSSDSFSCKIHMKLSQFSV